MVFYKQVLEFHCPSKFLCQTSGRQNHWSLLHTLCGWDSTVKIKVLVLYLKCGFISMLENFKSYFLYLMLDKVSRMYKFSFPVRIRIFGIYFYKPIPGLTQHKGRTAQANTCIFINNIGIPE